MGRSAGREGGREKGEEPVPMHHCSGKFAV